MILTRFRRNDDGGVAPFLALAAIPLMGFVAMAIDYSRASSVRTSFQAALDATALMLSKDANGLDPAQVAAKASGYFNALFNRPEAINVLIAHQL
ncbi:MAG: pilus assembly protein TadG-related protein, partial [Gammaproteobacteria bacterium]